jgi:hypothetical protein
VASICAGNTTVLTGQDGSVYFTPAGTEWCLLDWTDFPAGTAITVPEGHDYKVGDPVTFTEEGGGNLDSALTASTVYRIVAVTATTISVSATAGGTPITLTGDGGTGTGDTPGAANHIKVDYSEFHAICQVKSFSLDLSREEIDTTTLPCGVSGTGGNNKMAPFRTMQAGYASGSGSMEVQFSQDTASLANRLLSNSMMKSQAGAEVRLFINTVAGTGLGAGQPDLTKSLYIQAPISILGFSVSVSPEEVITASLNFSLSGQPSKLFV